ncbi:MAG: MFS transporter [Caulobacterales bacterium]
MTETQGEFARGWRTLLAASVGVGLGTPALINSASLFIIPMQQDFGWSRSALSIGPMVGFFYALLLPIASLVIDRVGVRKIALIGQIMLIAGFVMLAAMPAQAPIFMAVVFYLCVTATITGNVVYLRAVAGWFSRHSGKAFALVLSGVSVIGAIAQPLLAVIIRDHGWRVGYLAIGAAVLVAAMPLTIAWLREAPGAAKPVTKGAFDFRRFLPVLQDRRFWMILLAFATAALPIGGFVSQLQPLLVTNCFSVTGGAAIIASFLLITSIGRVLAGFLFDYVKPSLVAAGFLAMAGFGALGLAFAGIHPSQALLVGALIALIGLAQGAEGDFIALFTFRIFGVEQFSLVFSLVIVAVSMMFAIGGIAFSAAFDLTGSYQIAVIGSGVLFLFTAFVSLLIQTPPLATGAPPPESH